MQPVGSLETSLKLFRASLRVSPDIFNLLSPQPLRLLYFSQAQQPACPLAFEPPIVPVYSIWGSRRELQQFRSLAPN